MSSQPRSPVWSQPSASVLESVPTYLPLTWSPRIWISPGASGPRSSPVVVDDADLDARHRLADRRQAGLEQGLVAVEREAVVVGAEDRDGAAGLGEPVRVDEVGLGEQLQRPLEHRRGHAGAAVRRGPAGSGPAAFGSASMASHDAGEHGGHEHGVGDLLVAGGGEPLLGGEAHAGQRHDAPADVGVAEHRGDAGDVERRRRHDGRFVLTCRRRTRAC